MEPQPEIPEQGQVPVVEEVQRPPEEEPAEVDAAPDAGDIAIDTDENNVDNWWKYEEADDPEQDIDFAAYYTNNPETLGESIPPPL